MSRASSLRHAGLGVAVTIVVIAVWALVTSQEWVSPVFLPGPLATLASLRDGIADGDLLR